MISSNLHQAQSHEMLRSWQSQRNDLNHHKDFVLPVFIGNNDDAIEPIEAMPETFRYGCRSALEYLTPLIDQFGLRAILLFPVVTKCDRSKVDANEKATSRSTSNSSTSSAGLHSTSSDISYSPPSSSDEEAELEGRLRAGSAVKVERLIDEQDPSSSGNNPFLGDEEERHLLAADPAMSVPLALDPRPLAASPLGAPTLPPRRLTESQAQTPAQVLIPPTSRNGLPELSQTRDIKLIRGMALKDKYNPVLRLIPMLRARFPKLLIICDVCLCAFTSTGHCCLFEDHTRAIKVGTSATKSASAISHSIGPQFPISNETTCQYLAMLSLEYARRGCDVIAPSDMMDGRILTIRERLNQNGFSHVSILSYSAKFASAYYGPFRNATHNAPEFGDRRAYQLPPGSRALAAKAVQRDIEQGADFVMVKPASLYLDIVRDIRVRHPDVPVAIYQVSGEYSMLKMAAAEGLVELKSALAETLTAFRRAGATIIISYFTPQIIRGELSLDNDNQLHLE